ncbi:MAG TPA: hypothetical protein VF086_08010 [Propionibacteriaceae bacterium]
MSLVYATWLLVVEPHVLNGTRVKVELLVFKPGSFMQMVVWSRRRLARPGVWKTRGIRPSRVDH